MGFFSRLWRLIRGKANDGAEFLEDRNFETVVRQSVRDLETELNRVVKASAEAMSNFNRLEADYKKNERQSEEWKEKAKVALAAGNEELARKALEKKAEFDALMVKAAPTLRTASEVKDKLKKQVDVYRGKIEESKRNASTLIARKNAADAQKKVAKILAGVKDGDNAFAALSRFEETVTREEAVAQAYEEMGQTEDRQLEEQFANLQVSTGDDALEALKSEMAQEKLQNQKRL